MAGATRIGVTQIWIGPLVGAVLLFGAGRAAFAQAGQIHFVQAPSAPAGSLAGKLTNLYSVPLAGVTVILRNESTGAEVRTTTAKNGTYRFTTLDAGEYAMEADSPRLGRGYLNGILIDAGREARVQAAMSFTHPAPIAQAPVPLQAAREPAPQSVRRLASPSPAVTATLSSEPLRALPLPSQSTAGLTGPGLISPGLAGSGSASAPAAVPAPVTTASVAAVPPQRLPLAGMKSRMPAQKAPESTPSAKLTERAAQLPPASPAPQASLGSAVQHPVEYPVESPVQATTRQLAVLKPTAALKPALAGTLPRVAGLAAAGVPSLAATVAAGRAAMEAIVLIPPHQAAIEAATGAVAQQLNPVTTATVTAAQLQALPVSGQRWEEFMLDSPTAAAPAGSSQAALRGASQDPAETTIDGANTRLAFGNAAGSPSNVPEQGETGPYEMGQAWKGGHGFAVGESAIRQVKMVAGNVEAKGIYAAGGLTDVETESGGNPLHGQSFLFDRQNTWGARNPFTTWLQNTAAPGSGTPAFTSVPYTPPDHETNWGMGLGSHILRDKLFWFAALDNSQRNDPGVAMAKRPIGTYIDPTTGDAYCFGLFCPPSEAQVNLLCAQLGLSIPSPVGPSSCPVTEVTQDYSKMLEDLGGLLGPAPRTSTQRVGFARIDWKLAERHTITIEGIGAGLNAPGGGFTRVSENYGSHSFGSSGASQQWLMARWEAFLTPNLLAVTQASAGRAIFTALPSAPSSFEQQFLNGNTQLPEIVVDSSNGFTIGNPSRFGQGSYPDERLYHAQEMLNWVRGNLLINAGFELDHNSDATSLLRNSTGTYHYSHVANFISDALAFENFGSNPSTPQNPHTCGVTNTTFGALPCYSYYSQMIGPANWRNWHLSTNDWAGYVNAQWQPSKIAVLSFGLRWEREQLPPPIPALANPQPQFTETLPELGNNWGPRVGLAIGHAEGHWPVLRLGYGMYFARTQNATLETALTQTGSPNGDRYFFIRPTDGYTSINGTSAAPFFPNELEGPPGSVVKPGAVEFAPRFRNPEVHQAVAAVEETLPGRVQLTASALVSLGRRLPVSIDTNIDPTVNPGTITYDVCDQVPSGTGNGTCGNLGLGPIKATTITVPFYASWPSTTSTTGTAGRLNPDYQQMSEIESRANSTYEAATLKITRYGRRGLSLNAYYTYAHAMDWNPDESPLDPTDFSRSSPYYRQEYGTSNLDIRHSATAMLIYETPWKLHDLAGRIGNGWMISGIGRFQSGLPYTMRVSSSIPKEFDNAGNAIVGLGPGMNGSGGDSRVYGLGSDGRYYNIGRNTYRYPLTWRADLRLGKSFDLGQMRRLELLAQSFNLFNHQNVTEIETTGYFIDPGSTSSPPTLNFLTGLKTSSTTGLASPAFGQPLQINGANFYRERQIELGLRMTF